MGNSLEQNLRAVMSGEKRGIGADLLRGLLRGTEIPYGQIVRMRNGLYAHHILKSHRLARPVISVGNITTGGTGKTPVVRWLAEHLRDMRPAILMRGYKGTDEGSDEQMLLREQLGDVPVIARADRRRGAATALARQSDTGVFILDDGMQHRQVARDFELVLIDATSPFGFGHVLPRGLLREPLGGLARADAFLITRSDLVEAAKLEEIRKVLGRYHSAAPIFLGQHSVARFRCGEEVTSVESLRRKRLFLFCALGNPQGVRDQLVALNLNVAGTRFFSDHHSYTAKDLGELAGQSQGDLLLTTEKDWVKIAQLDHPARKTICRTELALTFYGDDEAKLLELIRLSIARPSR